MTGYLIPNNNGVYNDKISFNKYNNEENYIMLDAEYSVLTEKYNTYYDKDNNLPSLYILIERLFHSMKVK